MYWIKLLFSFLPRFIGKIIYCDTVAASETQIDMSVLFDSDKTTDSSEDSQLVDSENTDDLLETNARDHKLPVEDEFLMFMMKLKLGLTNLDLAIRFYISQGRVSNLVNSWLIYLYTFFGKLKIWPHRDVIIEQMPSKFKEEYPSTMIIIDCTELKIECPSSLLKQSETYSNYKSTNTVKGLVGVDAKGGIMYVSHLYTGLISDKEIVKRSGFMKLLKRKIDVGEILRGDSIMADKGFDISSELSEIGLNLNIPPFLRDQSSFSEDDVIRTQTIAQHRIHIERAIGKVRRFLIFSKRLPVSMLGNVNQLWSVCCMLSNFMDPIL